MQPSEQEPSPATADSEPPTPGAPTAEGEEAAAPDAAAPAGPADLSPAQCSARLAELFPALFRLQQPKPLKLRIQADIQTRAPGVFTRKSLSAFLHRYTTGTPYLVALTRETHRHDLDGQPAGELAAEHREAATTELARRRAIVEARRAAENAARREAEAAARQQRDADQQGRRERAQLLRAFETSTLTRANFCALKGLADSELDTLLAQARQEAAERPAGFDDRAPRRDAPPRPGQRPAGAPGPRPHGPREKRGPARRA
jgi:ProP effector